MADDGVGNSNDEGPRPVKRARPTFQLTMNNRTYSQSWSYKLAKNERDRIKTETLARAKKRDELFMAPYNLMRYFDEKIAARQREKLAAAAAVSTSPLDTDTVPPASSSEFLDLLASDHENAALPSTSDQIESLTAAVATLSAVDDNNIEVPARQEDGEEVVEDNDVVNKLDNDDEFEANDSRDDDERENENNDTEPKTFKELLREYKTELHGIFVAEGTTLKSQHRLLEFMRNLPEDVRKALPMDGRTLRPPPITFQRCFMHPGEFTYFGIENMLNYAPDVLFDGKANAINLMCNMDGLPLSKSPSGLKFWPILGSVDDYPVFVIAAYEGPAEPRCSNEYLKEFVKEVKRLCTFGCRVKKKTYRFRLLCLICDSPATCFVIGCKQHGGYCACRRCKTMGELVELPGVTVTNRSRTSVRYPALGDDPPRLHKEFVEFSELTADYHDAQPSNDNDQEHEAENAAPVPLPQLYYKYDVEKVGYRLYVEDKDGHILPVNDDDDGDEEEVLVVHEDYESSGGERSHSMWKNGRLHLPKERVKRKRRGEGAKAAKNRLAFHLHPTILTGIPDFDLVRCMVLDIMHMVYLGVVKTMLERWNGTSRSDKSAFKLSPDSLNMISARLHGLRTYCPAEFQRKPETLTHLASWKATQCRQFALYLAPVVLLGAVDQAQLDHFNLLVVAMRMMSRKLRDSPTDEKGTRVKKIARACRIYMRRFLEVGIQLYTKNFALYNAHHLVHIPDDYEKFKVSLDFLSGFRYENALGYVKRLISAHYKPLTQLENKLSSMLHTKMYTRTEKNRVVNTVEEYYELPELVTVIANDDTEDFSGGEVGRRLPSENERQIRYKEMRFRNFKIRVDSESDCHVLMSTKERGHEYVRVKKILEDMDTNEIFLAGYAFQRTSPLFSLKDIGFPDVTSRTAGITACEELSSNLQLYPLSALNEKCFAFPTRDPTAQRVDVGPWVFVRYLH